MPTKGFTAQDKVSDSPVGRVRWSFGSCAVWHAKENHMVALCDCPQQWALWKSGDLLPRQWTGSWR